MTHPKKSLKIPPSVQALLWSSGKEKKGIRTKDRPLLVHRVLAMGTLKDIKWLFKALPKKTIRSTFCKKAINLYTKAGFIFAAKTILGIRKPLSPSKYVKSVH